MVEADGGHVRFNFSEAREHVAQILTTLRRQERITDKEIDQIAEEIVSYVVTLIVSIKVTTKYKPWKQGKVIDSPHASVFKKGFYLGWAALQDVVYDALIVKR